MAYIVEVCHNNLVVYLANGLVSLNWSVFKWILVKKINISLYIDSSNKQAPILNLVVSIQSEVYIHLHSWFVKRIIQSLLYI